MSYAQPIEKNTKYYKPRDGQFVLEVSQSTPGATERHAVGKDGTDYGMKYELFYKTLTGKIDGIQFYDGQSKDGKKFKSLNIYLEKDEETGDEPVISMGMKSRESTDFLARLPNIDLARPAKFMPYAFEDSGNRGISVTQNDEEGNLTVKADNFFTRKVGEKWVQEHGYPEPTDEDKDDWAFYFQKVSKFLQKYTEEKIIPTFARETSTVTSGDFTYPEDEINPEDVPF